MTAEHKLKKLKIIKKSLETIKSQVEILKNNDVICGDLYENFCEEDKCTQIAERLLDEFVNPSLSRLG